MHLTSVCGRGENSHFCLGTGHRQLMLQLSLVETNHNREAAIKYGTFCASILFFTLAKRIILGISVPSILGGQTWAHFSWVWVHT